VQNSLYVQFLRSPILVALLHGTPPASVSQALRRGTWNGLTELAERASPKFGWAAITLGSAHISVSFTVDRPQTLLLSCLLSRKSKQICSKRSTYRSMKVAKLLNSKVK